MRGFRAFGIGDEMVDLTTYVERMKEGQEAIYYITAEDVDAARKSPQLEGFRAKGVEVLLLSDPVDDFWLGVRPAFEEKAFRSVTRGAPSSETVMYVSPARAFQETSAPCPASGSMRP